ncbi:MAG: MarR family transcriptional regulator [Actinomycetota bacterium]
MSDTYYATPTLMRRARGAYAQSIRAELHALGIEDLPRNGAFLLAGIDTAGGPRADLPAELGVTKQAVSQVVETLVNRGYLTRQPDGGDRRRVALQLTDRGREVVEAVGRGVEAVDRQLAERVAPEQVEAMRAALLALTEIRSNDLEQGRGRKRSRQLRSFSPIFPVADLPAALAHYQSLGFRTVPYEGGDWYGFANRDGCSLHLELTHDHGPAPEPGHHQGATAYLYVADADALYEEWTRPGIGGRTHPVTARPYGLREGAHNDPDGNTIRFGSPIED